MCPESGYFVSQKCPLKRPLMPFIRIYGPFLVHFSKLIAHFLLESGMKSGSLWGWSGKDAALPTFVIWSTNDAHVD